MAFFFFLAALQLMKVPKPGIELSHSCSLCHSYSSTGFLTHCTTQELCGTSKGFFVYSYDEWSFCDEFLLKYFLIKYLFSSEIKLSVSNFFISQYHTPWKKTCVFCIPSIRIDQEVKKTGQGLYIRNYYTVFPLMSH